jgi:hypothetical protein
VPRLSSDTVKNRIAAVRAYLSTAQARLDDARDLQDWQVILTQLTAATDIARRQVALLSKPPSSSTFLEAKRK